eukprot:jgi/Orpsp1_1/1176913/evm.model.c7180000059467.1
MHEKLKIETQNTNNNTNENENENNNIININILKSNRKDKPKNIKFNIKETIINPESTNYKNQYDKNNVNVNFSPNEKIDYENSNNNNNNNNNNSNNNINYHYQPINEKKNVYNYKYTKIHSHHPPLHPHSFSMKQNMDIHQQQHHHHHHQHRHSYHKKRIAENHKRNTDFIDNLNAQFKFNVESSGDIVSSKIEKKSYNEFNNNENIKINNNNDIMENKNINANTKLNNYNQIQHHRHYHPYSYQYEYPNYSNIDNNKSNGQRDKNSFNLNDIKVVLEAQSNKPLKKSISFSIENDDLRCPSNKPYHLKQRMENRQRLNSKNYEILANTKDLMLEKELNEREIKFYCLRVMEQNAQQKHTEFINQRKEKMQDHSKHINNVRRQNCLELSKWRCDRSHKMNIRQLKVEQNRRKIISNKKALYSSLVEKAKKVVIDLKKKEELEKLQILKSLNEKMNESEQRRQILRITSKSKILDVSSTLYQQQKLEKKATLNIQRWWRKKTFGTPLQKFLELDITSDIAKTLSFEKLHEKLHSTEAIEITKHLLNQVFKASHLNQFSPSKDQKNKDSNYKNIDGNEKNKNTEDKKSILTIDSNKNNTNNASSIDKANVDPKKKNDSSINKHFSEEKMFLSAFMIYGHSNIVISSLGDMEK